MAKRLTIRGENDIMSSEKVKISDEQKKAIEKTLANGDRIELIPVKDGVKIMQVQKKTLKTE